jgi:hypothetical protein
LVVDPVSGVEVRLNAFPEAEAGIREVGFPAREDWAAAEVHAFSHALTSNRVRGSITISVAEAATLEMALTKGS